MRLTFLGTKGEIEESSPEHKMNSALLIAHRNTRLLIDFGKTLKGKLRRIKPTHIVLTHAHSDHAWGFVEEDRDTDAYMLDAVWNTLKPSIRDLLDKRILHRYYWKKIGDIMIQPVPVSHSWKFPTNGFLIRTDHKTIGYFPDILSMRDRKKILSKLDLYIGDGSGLKEYPGRVRRDKRNRPYGHALIRDQVRWCAEAGVKDIIFTHCGRQIVTMSKEKLNEEIEKLEEEFDVKIRIATDDWKIELAKLKPLPGIYLVPNHGRYIAEGLKTLIISAKPAPDAYVSTPIYFVQDKYIYGILTIYKVRKESVDQVKRRLFEKHQITEEEWDKWWPDAKEVYLYSFEVNKLFIPPVLWKKRPIGPQKWIKRVELGTDTPENIMRLWKDLNKKFDKRPYTDAEWLKDEEWFGKAVVPTWDHKFLMSISWIHRPAGTQLKIYHAVKEVFDGYKKGIHQLTDGEIKKLPYHVDFQWKFLKNLRDYLKDSNQTFSQYVEKLKKLSPLSIRRLLQDVLQTSSSKLIEIFMRDYLVTQAFPIDFHVAGVLKKYRIPVDSELIIAYSQMLGICPRVLNRMTYALGEELSTAQAKLVKPERVKEVIEKPGLFKKWTLEQLFDDHRICHMWAGKEWKTLPHALTKQDVIKFHNLLIKEIRERSPTFKHTTPISASLAEMVGNVGDDSQGYKEDKIKEIEEPIAEIAKRARELSPYSPIHHYGEKHGRKIEIEEVLTSYDKPIVLVKGMTKLVGGIANWGDSEGDIDLRIATDDPDLFHIIRFRLGRALDSEISNRATYHDRTYEVFTSHVDLHDLVLLPRRQYIRMERIRDPKADREANQSKKEDKIEPLRFVFPLKGHKGYYRYAELASEVVEKWFPEDDWKAGIRTEKKYDGARIIWMKSGNKHVVRSDDGADITSRFPNVIKLADKILPHTVTIDIETELWKEGEHQSREITSGLLRSKGPADDSGLVLNVFDIIFLNDPKIEHHELKGTIGDLHDKPLELRRRFLELIHWPQSTNGVPKTQSFNLTPSPVAKNSADLVKLIQKTAKYVASEGTVLKSNKGTYELDGLTTSWVKWKKMADIHAVVIESIETRTKGVYNLRLGLRIPAGWKVPRDKIASVKGKQYVYIGKTFNVKGYKSPGTIVTLSFHTLFHHVRKRTDEQYVTAYEPKFIEIRPQQKTPDSAKEAIAIAKKAELYEQKILLQAFKMDDEPHKAVMQNHYRCDLDEFVPPEYGLPGSPAFEQYLDELIRNYVDGRLSPELSQKIKVKLEKVQLGKSVHMDLRIKMNGFLLGPTIAHLKPGKIKEAVETVKEAKRIESNWQQYFKMTNKPQTYLTGRRKLWITWKKSEPVEWLTVEGVVPKGEVGATRYEFGVFSIVDKLTVYLGTQKPAFREFFLEGKKFDGRWVARLLPNPWKEEMPRVEFVWLFWKPEDQTPYVLTRRAVQKKWIPPKGVSCLPPEIRQKVPTNLKYWLKDNKGGRISLRDELVGQIRKGEVKLERVQYVTMEEPPTIKEPIVVPGVLQHHWWEAKVKPVRVGPSEEHWDLRIEWDPKKPMMHFVLVDNPIGRKAIAATFKWDSDHDWLKKGEKIEFLKPGTPGNPTRATPAYIQILDKLKVTIYESSDVFVKMDIKGKEFKGHWVVVRTDPQVNIWELRKEEKAPQVEKSLEELLDEELQRLGNVKSGSVN